MIKVAFVCNYSTEDVRRRICASKLTGLRGLLSRLGFKGSAVYDFAPWIPEIIKSFENDADYEFNVFCLHPQMKESVVKFKRKGVFYHFLSANIPVGLMMLDKAFHYMERTDYRYFRKRIKKEIDTINPNIVCICGAENPSYSIIALEQFECPSIVILQTLLNSSKRQQYNFGSPYRRELEKRILSQNKYFWGYEPEAPNMIKQYNKEGVMMHFVFPSIQPRRKEGIVKEYDFVFYAGGLSKNKGIEDAIDALAIVKRSYPAIKMDVVGGCSPEYRTFLNSKIEILGLSDNIHFSGFFKEQSSVFKQVQKARCVLVPGITAPLNSTVREAMFMCLPTITYRTSATDKINEAKECVIAAEMENVKDLANKMLFVLRSPVSDIETIARNGYEYANKVFSSVAIGNNLRALLNAVLDNYSNKREIPDALICE